MKVFKISFAKERTEKKPGCQREVTLEEYWLHCMEEDHHKLDQLRGYEE